MLSINFARHYIKLWQNSSGGVIDIDSLLFVIVNRGKANAILHKAQEHGATGGTIFLGEGTVQSKLLEALGLTEVHKEILMISSSTGVGGRTVDGAGASARPLALLKYTKKFS